MRDIDRDRPWWYSVIPSTSDFPACTIILTHMLKQMKQNIIALMTMFKVNPGPPNEVTGAPQICMQRRGTRLIVALFILRLASCLVLFAVCFNNSAEMTFWSLACMCKMCRPNNVM